MRMLCRIIWPRTRASWADFLSVFVAGAVAGLGAALALGAASAVAAGQERSLARDGPRGIEPSFMEHDGPLRATRQVATAYGAVSVILLVGERGEELGLPGIPEVASSGTVQISTALSHLLDDDWSGELTVLVGARRPALLEREALAFPDELLIVSHLDAVPLGAERDFHPVRISGGPPPGGNGAASLAIVGLCVLLLPSLALGRASVIMHLSRRQARYALLRRLGATPNSLRAYIAVDLGVPWFAGIAFALGGFAVVAQLDAPFRLVGASYWWSDMRLSMPMALGVFCAAAVVYFLSTTRTTTAVTRDPLARGESDRAGRRLRGTWIGMLVAPLLAYWALQSSVSPVVSQLLIASALLMAVVGLGSLTRSGSKLIGRVLYQRSWTPFAGARMFRSPQTTLTGLAGATVAMMFIAFVVQANFSGSTAPTDDYEALVEVFYAEDGTEAETAVANIASLPGVTDAMVVTRALKEVDGHETLVYSAPCATLNEVARLSDECETGMAYVADSISTEYVFIDLPDSYSTSDRAQLGAVGGTYSVAGRVDASWIAQGDIVVSAPLPDADPVALTLVFVATDGTQLGLRSALVETWTAPGVSSVISQSALGIGASGDDGVLEPYLLLMAVAAGAIAGAALVYSTFALFRSQADQFAMMRAVGQLKWALAVDVSILFLMPLMVATAIALSAGTLLAYACNLALGADSRGFDEFRQFATVLGVVAASATALVWIRATRVEPLVRDPDATV